MLIGVLSDSHGRAVITWRAVEMLLNEGAQQLIHLGDVGKDAVIDTLVGHDSRMVLGNCDWPEQPLIDYARSVDVIVDHPVGRLSVDGRIVVFTHGHLELVMRDVRDVYLLALLIILFLQGLAFLSQFWAEQSKIT